VYRIESILAFVELPMTNAEIRAVAGIHCCTRDEIRAQRGLTSVAPTDDVSLLSFCMHVGNRSGFLSHSSAGFRQKNTWNMVAPFCIEHGLAASRS